MSRKVIKEFYESAKRYCDFVSNNVITNIIDKNAIIAKKSNKHLMLPVFRFCV